MFFISWTVFEIEGRARVVFNLDGTIDPKILQELEASLVEDGNTEEFEILERLDDD